MKLALGTVQLGIPYGIANHTGMPDEATAGEILCAARDCGYAWLDTAATYGSSEALLGRLMPKVWGEVPPPIVTKIVLDEHKAPREQFAACLSRLARPSADVLLLHHETDLDHIRLPEFRSIHGTGLARHLGVSCYQPERAIQGLNAGFTCLQVQCNLFDTSHIESGVFSKAAEIGAVIFVRSIFLQGLFFLAPDHPHAMRIPGASDALRFLNDFCLRHAVSPAELAISLGASLPDAVIVLGAESPRQVRENAQMAVQSAAHVEIVDRWLRERPVIPGSVTRTGGWPKG